MFGRLQNRFFARLLCCLGLLLSAAVAQPPILFADLPIVPKPFVNFLSDNVRNLNGFMGFTKEHEFTIKDMWFAINRKGSYHETHTHTPSIWSGVYYVVCL